MNDEVMVRNILKEEEFLEEFGHGGIVSQVFTVIGQNVWSPDYGANDDRRKQLRYAFERGYFEDKLFFASAAVYHNNHMFSSVQIVLNSPKRIVTVRVSKSEDGRLTAEKVVDKAL